MYLTLLPIVSVVLHNTNEGSDMEQEKETLFVRVGVTSHIYATDWHLGQYKVGDEITLTRQQLVFRSIHGP